MARCSSCGIILVKDMNGTCYCGQEIVKKSFLSRIFKKRKSNSIIVKNSSISGDVIADATDSSTSQGNTIELTNSNIMGDLVQNNIDVDEIIEKFSSLLDEKVFTQSGSETTDEKREQLFEEVLIETKKGVDQLDDDMLKISSLNRISRAADKAGYRKKATKIDIEVGEILAKQNDWDSKINGYLKLSSIYSNRLGFINMKKAEKYAKDAVEICALNELEHLERKVELNLVEVLQRSFSSFAPSLDAEAVLTWHRERKDSKLLMQNTFSGSNIHWRGIRSYDDYRLGEAFVRSYMAGHLHGWDRETVKDLIKMMLASEHKNKYTVGFLYQDLWQLRLGNTIFYTGLLIGYLIKFLLFKPIGLVITLSTAGLLYLIL